LQTAESPARVSEPDDIVDSIITDLLTIGVVGLCHGPMEAGPRALGNRSVLADPRIPAMKHQLNRAKKRENFRPFGASLLYSRMEELGTKLQSSPFMNMSASANGIFRASCPAVVHCDGRVRYHTADGQGTLLETVLGRWMKETECPTLLNT